MNSLEPNQPNRDKPTIDPKDRPFLEKVMKEGGLADLYDARDATNIVFRTMRDMMTNEAADRVASELHEEAEPDKDKTLQTGAADLWKDDTNPIVGFLTRVRPPLKIKSVNFLRRIDTEGGLTQGAEAETVTKAVFSAAKEQLSHERIQEIASWMPEGRVSELWSQA